MTRCTSPSWAKWLAPASPSSPNPHGWSNVRPRGRPVARNRRSIADITASARRSRPAPSTPTVAPSRTRSAAASAVRSFPPALRELIRLPRSLCVRRLAYLPGLDHEPVLPLVHHFPVLVHERQREEEDAPPGVLRRALVSEPAPNVDGVAEEHRLPEVPGPAERGDSRELIRASAQLQALGDREPEQAVGDPAAVGRALGELLADVHLAPVVRQAGEGDHVRLGDRPGPRPELLADLDVLVVPDLSHRAALLLFSERSARPRGFCPCRAALPSPRKARRSSGRAPRVPAPPPAPAGAGAPGRSSLRARSIPARAT